MSRRNKIARSHRIHNHTRGTKSFARVAKEQEKALGRPPTRSEMFKYVMTSKNGTESEATKNAIAKMAEKENENPELSTQGCSKNDLFAQIMGLDRNGRVRMDGAGVSPSMVFNNARSGANQIAAIRSLQEHNKKLLDEVEHWKSMANGAYRVQYDSDETQPPDDISPILNIANRVDLELPSTNTSISANTSTGANTYTGANTSTSADCNLQVGTKVFLKSILDASSTIAVGILYSTDPAQEVNDRELGDHHFEIYVQCVVVPTERLVRPCRQLKTIGETVGMHIAWPKAFVFSEAMEAYCEDERVLLEVCLSTRMIAGSCIG